MSRLILSTAACLLFAGCVHPAPRPDTPRDTENPRSEAPQPFRGRGRLACAAEVLRDRYGVEVPPVHDHLWGFQVEPAGGGRPAPLYVLLRTALSEALFTDSRFREHTLVLEGRTFPGTGILEVTRFRWIRDGRLFDVYYWCDTCSIRTVDPGPCACCQAPVELREKDLGPAADTDRNGRAKSGKAPAVESGPRGGADSDG